jgi:hypothetical protein
MSIESNVWQPVPGMSTVEVRAPIGLEALSALVRAPEAVGG